MRSFSRGNRVTKTSATTEAIATMTAPANIIRRRASALSPAGSGTASGLSWRRTNSDIAVSRRSACEGAGRSASILRSPLESPLGMRGSGGSLTAANRGSGRSLGRRGTGAKASIGSLAGDSSLVALIRDSLRLTVTHAVGPPHSAKLQGKARAGVLVFVGRRTRNAIARYESGSFVPRLHAAGPKSDGSKNLKPGASPSIALPVPGGPAFAAEKRRYPAVSPERDATRTRHY